jgi:hypothetical protein
MLQDIQWANSVCGESCEQKPACSAHQCCEAGRSPYRRMHEHATTQMDIRSKGSKFSTLLTDCLGWGRSVRVFGFDIRLRSGGAQRFAR